MVVPERKWKPLKDVIVGDKSICVFLSDLISSEKELENKYKELYDKTYLYHESETFKKLLAESKSRSKRIKKVFEKITCTSEAIWTEEDREKFKYYSTH